MYKTLLAIFIIIAVNSRTNAQNSLSFDAGQVFAKFNFYNSDGDRIKDFNYHIAGSYSLDYHYVSKEGLFVRGGIGMRKAGATMVYENIPLTWNLHYADAFFGFGYQLNKYRFKPYISFVPYYGYLLKAWQTIGPEDYDLKKGKELKNFDYGLFIVPGFKVSLSEFLSVYAEYKQMMGIANIETANAQRLYNRGFILNMGVSATITKHKTTN
jgi:hypothetical protein